MLTMIIRNLLLTAMLLIGFVSTAAADFYVIPINKKIKNVITVAKSGAQFTDVKAAMDSITDANETNRYLVYVGPGVYTVTAPIQLKSHITLKGSGEQATLLKGAISTANLSSSAIILGENNATLSEIGVENTGGSTRSIGIYNFSSPTITNVTVTASGGNYNYGVLNDSSSSATIINVTATALGGTYNYGLFNNISPSPKIYYSRMTGSTGAIQEGTGTPKCFYCVGNSDAMLNTDCTNP